MFGGRIFPATGAWPTGVAVASTIEAGDEGGKKSVHLAQGLVVGAIAGFFGIPMAGVGIVFIANIGTMAALAAGILIRGYAPMLGFDIGNTNIAQGMMIGAGIIALIQVVFAVFAGANRARDEEASHSVRNDKSGDIGLAAILFAAGSILIAMISGAFADMSLAMSVGWVAFAGLGSVMIMILVGTASMHSGWAPAFAVVTICLTIGLLVGFPPVPLAVLIGYLGSVGLPISDAGIGLKTGWIIRGKGTDAGHELFGRHQQVIVKIFGCVVGIGVAVIFSINMVEGGVIPPMSLFYADTVTAVADPALLGQLALWAVPGAALQAVFGSKSVGLMLAAGLLINNPIFGITIFAAIVARLIFGTKHMGVRGPGLIAGDGIYGFGASIFNMIF